MCGSVSGTPAPCGEEQTLGLTGQPVQPTDELSEALKKMEDENKGSTCMRAHVHIHSHAQHTCACTYNQTEPLFLPAKAAADLLCKTNELGSWALELNGTQLL